MTTKITGEKVRVRVLQEIPVFDGYAPNVGEIYDARKMKLNREYSEICTVRVRDKDIILRRTFGVEPEYEEVLE